LARFARNLAITLNAGIPIRDALRLSGGMNSHSEFAHLITIVNRKINAGLQLHHAMSAQPGFPVLMIQLVKIGEETGMIDQMLNKTADFFESEVDLLLSQLGLLLEPLIMLVLGVLIGGLVIGMYLPIFNLGSAL
jgi:type IV pilus assembly protein PilC